MKRTSTLIAAALAGLAADAHAEEVLRATTMLPRGVVYTQSFLEFVDKVNAEAAGVVRIEVLGGPEAIPTPEQANALRSGVVDMIHGPASYYPGDVPETDALVGSNLSAVEQRANGGLALLNEVHQKKLNAYLLAHPESGVGFHIYLTERPPLDNAGLPDLSGMRIRGAQLYREFFIGLGATYVTIPAAEVYTALERGTVSGAGWPSVGVMDLSWDNFLKYRIDPGFFQTDLVVLVNLDRWKALGEDARAALERLAIAYERDSTAAFDALEAAEDAELRSRGLEVIALSAAAGRAYRKAAFETAWERMRARDPTWHDALRAKFYREE